MYFCENMHWLYIMNLDDGKYIRKLKNHSLCVFVHQVK